MAEVTTFIRGLPADVDIDYVKVGFDRPSVINCDGTHTLSQASLTGPVDRGSDNVMLEVCLAINSALGC